MRWFIGIENIDWWANLLRLMTKMLNDCSIWPIDAIDNQLCVKLPWWRWRHQRPSWRRILRRLQWFYWTWMCGRHSQDTPHPTCQQDSSNFPRRKNSLNRNKRYYFGSKCVSNSVLNLIETSLFKHFEYFHMADINSSKTCLKLITVLNRKHWFIVCGRS